MQIRLCTYSVKWIYKNIYTNIYCGAQGILWCRHGVCTYELLITLWASGCAVSTGLRTNFLFLSDLWNPATFGESVDSHVNTKCCNSDKSYCCKFFGRSIFIQYLSCQIAPPSGISLSSACRPTVLSSVQCQLVNQSVQQVVCVVSVNMHLKSSQFKSRWA